MRGNRTLGGGYPIAARLTHEWIMQESNLLPYQYSSHCDGVGDGF
jgi:hypothetical protein